MSEILNLIPDSPDIHVYLEAIKILSSELDTDYSFVLQIWDREIPKTKYKKILILTSDEKHQIPTQHFDKDVFHIFKQYAPMKELRNPKSVVNVPNITALPLCHLDGVKNKNIPIKNRTFDWCWMGQFDPYSRVDFKKSIDTLSSYDFRYKCIWYNGWNNGVSKEEYSDILNNTKIALVPVGSASIETFRFFEAMMCGCVVIGVEQPNVYFYNEAPYIKIDHWNDNLNKIIEDTLSKINMMEELSEMSISWYDKFCSPKGMANYMMEALGV